MFKGAAGWQAHLTDECCAAALVYRDEEIRYIYKFGLSGFQNLPENSRRWTASSDRAKSVHVSVTVFSCEGKRKRNNDQHLYKIKLKMPNDKSDLLLQMLTVIFHLLGNSVIWFKWTKNRSGAEGGSGVASTHTYYWTCTQCVVFLLHF